MNELINDKITLCGKKYRDKNAQYLCLSPLPIANEYDSDSAGGLFNCKKNGILELCQVNNSGRYLGLIQLVILACVIMVIGALNILRMIVVNDFSAIFGILLPLIALFYIMYFSVHDSIVDSKKNIPIRFNFYRKEILISYDDNAMVRPTFFGGMNNGGFDKGSSIRLFSLFSGYIIFTMGFSSMQNIDTGVKVFGIIASLIGLGLLIYACYPLLKYFYFVRNNKSEIKLKKVNWESININYIKYDSITTATIRTTHALNFSIPLQNNKYVFNIPAWSKQNAFEIFSFINNYMENGGGINHEEYEIDSCLSNYQERNDFLKNESFAYPLWKIWNIITLRSIACRLVDKINNPGKNELENHPEVVEWMRQLPQSEQVCFSKELQEVNSRVRKLYKKGHHWEDKVVQDIIRQYDDITVQRVKCQTDTE